VDAGDRGNLRRSHDALSRHASVTLATAGRRDMFGKVFTFIERFHVEGDEYVRQLATIGYLFRTSLSQAPGRPTGSRISSQ
jgi:hypothetical protein